MNQPYVKKYDANGVCTNPIVGSYTSPFPNRRTRNNPVDKNANRKVMYVQYIERPRRTVTVTRFPAIFGDTWEKVYRSWKRIVHYEFD